MLERRFDVVTPLREQNILIYHGVHPDHTVVSFLPSLSLSLSLSLSRRCYCRAAASLNFSSSLPTRAPDSVFDCRNPRFPPARTRELYFNSDSPLSAFRSCDIRAGHYCPWYWRCRPCYARTPRIDPRRIYPYLHTRSLLAILCVTSLIRTAGIPFYLSSRDIKEHYIRICINTWQQMWW